MQAPTLPSVQVKLRNHRAERIVKIPNREWRAPRVAIFCLNFRPSHHTISLLCTGHWSAIQRSCTKTEVMSSWAVINSLHFGREPWRKEGGTGLSLICSNYQHGTALPWGTVPSLQKVETHSNSKISKQACIWRRDRIEMDWTCRLRAFLGSYLAVDRSTAWYLLVWGLDAIVTSKQQFQVAHWLLVSPTRRFSVLG